MAAFHALAYPHAWGIPVASVRSVGDYHWREGGERHTHEPNSIASVQVPLLPLFFPLSVSGKRLP